jgi:hypothetical protein
MINGARRRRMGEIANAGGTTITTVSGEGTKIADTTRTTAIDGATSARTSTEMTTMTASVAGKSVETEMRTTTANEGGTDGEIAVAVQTTKDGKRSATDTAAEVATLNEIEIVVRGVEIPTIGGNAGESMTMSETTRREEVKRRNTGSSLFGLDKEFA